MAYKYDEPLEQVLKARASLRDMEEKKSQRGCGRKEKEEEKMEIIMMKEATNPLQVKKEEKGRG